MSGVLVIVELGAEWPSWLGTAVETVPGRGDRRVLSQTEGEGPEAFAERVAQRLQPLSLFDKRVSLERVVIACNERSDERAMTARSKLSQALLGTLAEGRSWQLLFTASGRTGRVRTALSNLATTLSSPLSSKAVAGGSRRPQHHTSIGVRFGDEMPLVQQANVA
jgi:hypothetical protein